MANQSTNSEEFLLLTDENGNYFAIPRGTVGQYRAKGEQKDRIEQALGEDVSGFGMYEQHFNEFRTSTYQAEHRQEAAQERLARSGNSGEDNEVNGLRESITGLGQMLTGMWRNLPFLRPTSTQP